MSGKSEISEMSRMSGKFEISRIFSIYISYFITCMIH